MLGGWASAGFGGGACGGSTAIAAAAIPKVNRVDVIKIPDLFMGSPSVVLTSATKNTANLCDHLDAEEVPVRAQVSNRAER